MIIDLLINGIIHGRNMIIWFHCFIYKEGKINFKSTFWRTMGGLKVFLLIKNQ